MRGDVSKRKELSNWFFARLVLTMLGRMLRNATSERRWNEAQRFPVKFKQHSEQITKLRNIAVELAKLPDGSGFKEVLPYLGRLDEFFEKPYTLDEIPALCEESRAMLFPFDAAYEKYTGKKYTYITKT
jgi:hypothetical protein